MLAQAKPPLASDLYCWVFLTQSNKYLSPDREEIKRTAFWLQWCLQHLSLIENQTPFGMWMRMLCCQQCRKWVRIRTSCWTNSIFRASASQILLNLMFAFSVVTQHLFLERKSTALFQNLVSYLSRQHFRNSKYATNIKAGTNSRQHDYSTFRRHFLFEGEHYVFSK